MARANGKEEKTVLEKCEEAYREWFKKAEQILKNKGLSSNAGIKGLADAQNLISQEYNKLFGRQGMHPLLHIKDGKQAPRYILDRDETWVLYKPPVWQMGGSEWQWRKRIDGLRKSKARLVDAQKDFLDSDKAEALQEWHGLTQGTWYVDEEAEQYRRENKPADAIKDWGFVQRLDMETDGPVIIGKTWRSQRVLHAQMQEHLIGKAYMCLVHGRVENRIQFVKGKWAVLGGDDATCIQVKHDLEHDPFFDLTAGGGRWNAVVGGGKREVRMAETFLKPIAYYRRKEDNTDYTLVYVNILSGITHQVRITMQSIGHPLVSDDRYLPKEQAHADIKWCPRNFLVEVRSDWFDIFGPHEDAPRRKYTRVSMENPLPRLFQNILENRLELVEQLDQTADLYQGCQYWSLGDEQLMAKYPKEAEFRRKVIRWGQRRGIHLDALDRLLLLDRDTINTVLSKYKTPDEDDQHWVCPSCMTLNMPDTRSYSDRDPNVCRGGGALGRWCGQSRIVDEDFKLLDGWCDFLSDPTFHLLMIVNPLWLQARRDILRTERPNWERPRPEPEGTRCTEDILLALQAALVLDVRKGGFGISEENLKLVPGLENIRLPLGQPPADSVVFRTRLPGKGEGSQWKYCLKGKERIKHTEKYAVKGKKLTGKIALEAVELTKKMLPSNFEIMQRRKEKERLAAEAEVQRVEKRERDANAAREANEVAMKKKRSWKKIKSAKTGDFYYFDAESGDTQAEMPFDYIEEEDREPAPLPSKKAEPELLRWKRMESKSKPGQFYYFNSLTGVNEVNPPVVDPPWKLCQSATKPGQFYYSNMDTGESVVDPPLTARPAPAGTKRPAPAPSAEVKSSEPPLKRIANGNEVLPDGWSKKESDTHKGKFYYINAKTGKTSWDKPIAAIAAKPSPWVKKESSSHPGKFYYFNTLTNETKWTQPKE
eukprot:TRINITY_DN54407_c0_g1_i1.p1 TRINITY_DN54407_c0_g1~~TRINITY_DN54407_c0_g1_i1.p1  ORF type:complete len:936 (-),score=186.79 TRINITY_DN54407_c0_g1_i1:29-2836(-)